jgi:hypothetical protein
MKKAGPLLTLPSPYGPWLLGLVIVDERGFKEDAGSIRGPSEEPNRDVAPLRGRVNIVGGIGNQPDFCPGEIRIGPETGRKVSSLHFPFQQEVSPTVGSAFCQDDKVCTRPWVGIINQGIRGVAYQFFGLDFEAKFRAPNPIRQVAITSAKLQVPEGSIWVRGCRRGRRFFAQKLSCFSKFWLNSAFPAIRGSLISGFYSPNFRFPNLDDNQSVQRPNL